jgi:ParB family chromosome partitioning protein
LNLACADLIADYEASSQDAFWEMCTIEGYFLKKATVQYIVKKCPPPAADRQQLFAAWREARAEAEQRRLAPPKKITFDRKQFAPYLDKLGSEQKLEELFLEFLRERVQ